MPMVSLRAKIKAKLDAHTGTGQPLVQVYEAHETALSGFPCVTFDLSQSDEDFATTDENEEKQTFELYVHVPIDNNAPNDRTRATKVLDTILDALLADFRSDYNLGGTIAWCKPAATLRGEYPGEAAGAVMYGKMTLECHSLIH